jgi:hypothetical protein
LNHRGENLTTKDTKDTKKKFGQEEGQRRILNNSRPRRLPSKAVLKSPQSKRWRDGSLSPKHAKRLDCGVFTAAFRFGTDYMI